MKNVSSCKKFGFNVLMFLSPLETALRAVMGTNNAITLKEHIASFFPKWVEKYCRARAPVILNEIEYARGALENKFQKIVIVGGGPIPFSAIYLARIHDGPIFVLEKLRSAQILSTRLVHRLKLKNVKILHGLGEDYEGYKDCVVIITLYAVNKKDILEKILGNGQRNNLVLLRSFFDEDYDYLGREFQVIEHGPNVRTLVIPAGPADGLASH